jgi:hypothetical protein
MKKAEQTTIAINEVENRVARSTKTRVTSQEPNHSCWQLRGDCIQNVAGKGIILRTRHKDEDLQGVVGLAGKTLKGLR